MSLDQYKSLQFKFLYNHFHQLSQKESSVFYQTSAIQKFWEGQYDGIVPAEQLLKLGDMGLGTFDGVDGELILVDGKLHKVPASGIPQCASHDETCPFAVVAQFVPEVKDVQLKKLDFNNLKSTIESLMPNQELAYLFKIEGTFKRIIYRSINKQIMPYKLFKDVVKEQVVFEVDSEVGTIVGFWFPSTAAGIQLVGFHLHYVSADLKRGGHILDASVESAQLQLQSAHTLKILT